MFHYKQGMTGTTRRAATDSGSGGRGRLSAVHPGTEGPDTRSRWKTSRTASHGRTSRTSSSRGGNQLFRAALRVLKVEAFAEMLPP